MAVAEVKSGVIIRKWMDVKDTKAFTSKYGVLSDTILVTVDDNVKVGWVEKSEGYFSPPDPEPAETLAREREGMVCSRFQAKAALLQAGLLDQVEAVLAEADPVAKLAWADAVEFRRNSPTIAALAKSVDMTDEQVDDLFRAAMKIRA